MFSASTSCQSCDGNVSRHQHVPIKLGQRRVTSDVVSDLESASRQDKRAIPIRLPFASLFPGATLIHLTYSYLSLLFTSVFLIPRR